MKSMFFKALGLLLAVCVSFGGGYALKSFQVNQANRVAEELNKELAHEEWLKDSFRAEYDEIFFEYGQKDYKELTYENMMEEESKYSNSPVRGKGKVVKVKNGYFGPSLWIALNGNEDELVWVNVNKYIIEREFEVGEEVEYMGRYDEVWGYTETFGNIKYYPFIEAYKAK